MACTTICSSIWGVEITQPATDSRKMSPRKSMVFSSDFGHIWHSKEDAGDDHFSAYTMSCTYSYTEDI